MLTCCGANKKILTGVKKMLPQNLERVFIPKPKPPTFDTSPPPPPAVCQVCHDHNWRIKQLLYFFIDQKDQGILLTNYHSHVRVHLDKVIVKWKLLLPDAIVILCHSVSYPFSFYHTRPSSNNCLASPWSSRYLTTWVKYADISHGLCKLSFLFCPCFTTISLNCNQTIVY